MAITDSVPTAVVSGGSLSGLMAAITLKDLGYRVTVFERSTTVESQGAGIVLGKWSSGFFNKFDKTETEISVPISRRQFFNLDGSTITEEEIKLGVTSWDKLYYTLRANYDGYIQQGYLNKEQNAAQKDDKTDYFMSTVVVSHAYNPDKGKVTVTYRKKEGNESQTEVDLFVCAEGASSSSRELYFPDLTRKYAGYLAFRGLVPEKELKPETAKKLINSISFLHAEDSQFLCYPIPGPGGSLVPGERHMNFVWYNTYPEGPILDKVLTDKQGKRRPFSVTTGSMPTSVVEEEIHAKTRAKLSPECLELVMKTKHPFVQVVTDVISPAGVFHDGHVILVGDAFSGARPHTAASTNKAADHALRLHEVLKADPRNLLRLKEAWEPRSMEYSNHLFHIGKRIGDLSQFDVHPMRADKEIPDRTLEDWMKVGEPK
ncbi:hypothetical protein M422DRAFT_272755 [Sphaerobolus stellatus SS14]|uniref:FAD-binding domain-containing protein n=1 Tax=Sphaerobolus stellatus (strain SS14) TaxID=990650 RepID=A0A0C9UAR8_SPHS4|nr:hypothetical protein M422DRAFT_272755 [Sphaerobolus stellatus SS14]